MLHDKLGQHSNDVARGQARGAVDGQLLKGLLDDIGWSEEDLKRLKLIK